MIAIKKLIIILAISISIILTGCWIVPPPEPEPEVVYRALLVGVGDYIGCGSDLKSPPYNVDRMREIFGNCRFGKEETDFSIINELKDKKATKKAVLDEIWYTFRDATDDDISYFYWCGHGTDRYGVYICPADSDFGDTKTYISVEELENALDAIAGTKVIILEACHSGNFIEKSMENFNSKVIEIFSRNQSIELNKDSYQVITSCAGSQVCWEVGHGDKPYTYFTMAVYQGFQNLSADINEDKIIDLYEIYSYVQGWVIEHTNKDQATQMYPDESTFPIIEY
ncbi:caspase family protein [candidate division WOR-3 bacterium]|nr:caspase family protein [candidate division WOR-3 bacterium]